MQEPSPYLKPNRLGDVIAAVQFLGQYDDYKLSVAKWNDKLASMPKSTEQKSWSVIFDEHPEFFRKNGRWSNLTRVATGYFKDSRRHSTFTAAGNRRKAN